MYLSNLCPENFELALCLIFKASGPQTERQGLQYIFFLTFRGFRGFELPPLKNNVKGFNPKYKIIS